jgi:Mitochondrial carrier protein
MPHNILETGNELIAGSFGGAAQVLVGQPLDTVKTRAQIAPSSVRTFMSHTHHLTIMCTPVQQRACLLVLRLSLGFLILSEYACTARKGP